MQSAPSDAVNLALGELGFPLPEPLRRKALELLQTGTPVYTPNAGISELRTAVASMYPGCSAEQICICNGAEEALFLALLSFLEPGAKIAIPDPDYPAYIEICKMLDINILRLPFESDFSSVDWPIWEGILAQDVQALIFSRPGNPTGISFTPLDLLRLQDVCTKHEIAVILDEVYSTLCFDEALAEIPSGWSGLIRINSLSKSHCMSGWRLGWVVSPRELSASIIKAKQYVSTCANWLSQQLAVFALSDDGMQCAVEVRKTLIERRTQALSILAPFKDRLHIPSATPYLMLKAAQDDVAFCQDLAAKGVLCVPGSAFGEVSRGWVRINYAVDSDALEIGLKILLENSL
jgi:aspartate/methionine/tyrosine aminotransferase